MALPFTYGFYRMFGVFPFRRRKFCLPLFIASFLFLSTILVSYVWCYYYIFSLFMRPSHLRTKRVYDILYLVSLMIVVASHVWSIYQNRRKFEHVFDRVHPRKVDLFEAVSMLATFESMTSHFLSRSYHLPYAIDAVLYLTVFCIVGQIQASYISLVRQIERRLSQLQIALRDSFAIDCVEQHTTFMGTVNVLNQIFGPQILLLVFIASLSQIIYSYEIINRLFDPELRTPGRSLLKLVNKSSQLFIILHTCERTRKKAEAFYNELFKLMSENTHLCKDNKLLLCVTVRQSVNFTACGFFNLGYPLVTSIITAVATYLVILIQFSMPPSKT